VLVVFAITVTSMLAVIGLLYSFGVILSQRRALQAAADAAALSGSWQVIRELAADTRSSATVYSAIQQYATANGALASGVSAVYVDASGISLGAVSGSGTFSAATRGVSVTVAGQVSTILPGFVSVASVLVRDTATSIARPTTPPASAAPVIPLAVRAFDLAAAYAGYSTFELLGGNSRSLNLALSGAPSCGGCTTATNMQYWSDGQHEGSWQLNQGNATLADANYFDAIATGLSDNLRRQGGTYAVVIVPVYDTSTATTVHVSGFAQINLRSGSINTSAPSARGVWVPYATAAYGTVTVPSPDIGAALIGLTQ
jgi:Flp pilus assembly protein TadG